jgi:hypothetical protein
MIKQKVYNVADATEAQECHDAATDLENKISNGMAHVMGFASSWVVSDIMSKHYGHHFPSKSGKALLFVGLTGIGSFVKVHVTKACTVDPQVASDRVAHKINKKREKIGLPPLKFD